MILDSLYIVSRILVFHFSDKLIISCSYMPLKSCLSFNRAGFPTLSEWALIALFSGAYLSRNVWIIGVRWARCIDTLAT